MASLRKRPRNYDQWMAARTTHGAYAGGGETPTHYVWRSMMARCHRPTEKTYSRYGGRGIKVCIRWHTYENFLADMGERPSSDLQLNRIDNDGDYEPANCEWATRSVQQKNKQNTRRYKWKGALLTPSELAEAIGISRALLSYRLRRGQYGDARVEN